MDAVNPVIHLFLICMELDGWSYTLHPPILNSIAEIQY